MRYFKEDFVAALSGDRPYIYVNDKEVPVTTYGVQLLKDSDHFDDVVKLLPIAVGKFGFQGSGKQEKHPDFPDEFQRPAIIKMFSSKQVSDSDWTTVIQAAIDGGHSFEHELAAGTLLNFMVKQGRVNTAVLMVDNAQQLGITETALTLGVNDASIAAAVRSAPSSGESKESFEHGVISLLKSYDYDKDARVISPSSPFTLERAIESSECNRVFSFLQADLTRAIAVTADIHADNVAAPETLNIRGRGFD